MSEELKPCPFCGYNARFTKSQGVSKVWCIKCGTSSGLCPYDHAIERWNTRTSEDALKKVIADIAATLAMGSDLQEDDIFAMCKDAIGEKAILDRYNEKLRERVGDL